MKKEVIKIDKFWSLFLDRDGVINKKIDNDYIKNVNEFEFLPKVKDELAYLKRLFNRILIVTNQQGIGKGLMTKEDLLEVHIHMLNEFKSKGITIDRIYYCPDLAENNPICRKPNIGMGLKAKKDFPDIDFDKSIIVGDSLSDMEFGYNLGMKSIMITNNKVKASEAKDKYNSIIIKTFDEIREVLSDDNLD